jgi:threonine synthase
VIDGNDAIRECRTTGGTGHLVSDEEVWKCQALLAKEEGILCEPAGAIGLAAVLKAVGQSPIARDSHIVCVLTGSGFKDVSSLGKIASRHDSPLIDVRHFYE